MNTCAPVPSLQSGVFLPVVVEDPRILEDELAAAVDLVRGLSGEQDRSGILITRRSRSLFTVELNAGVPYGITMERDLWHRGGGSRPGGEGFGEE